jgi:hypothetical protein
MVKAPAGEAVKGFNPIIAIAIAITIAFFMVLATTITFLRSSAYTTVKQIQIGIQATESMNQGNLDITSPINAIDIDQYATGINQRLDMMDDYADFGPEAVADAQLGLSN